MPPMGSEGAGSERTGRDESATLLSEQGGDKLWKIATNLFARVIPAICRSASHFVHIISPLG